MTPKNDPMGSKKIVAVKTLKGKDKIAIATACSV